MDKRPVEEIMHRRGPSYKGFMNFFKALFGAGMLMKPYALSRTGIIAGAVAYTATAVLIIYTMFALLKSKQLCDGIGLEMIPRRRCTDVGSPRCATYSDLGQVAFGRRVGVFLAVSIGFLQVCFCTGFLMVIAGILEQVSGLNREVSIFLVLQPCLFVLVLIEKLVDLWGISALGFIVFAVGVMGATLWYGAKNWAPPSEDLVLETNWGELPGFIGNVIYGMDGINLVLPTYRSLTNPISAFWVIPLAIIGYELLSLFYSVFGVLSGLALCGESLITECMPPTEPATYVIKVALAFALLMTYPVQLYPAIEIFENIICDMSESSPGERSLTEVRNHALTFKVRACLRWTLVVLTCVLGYSIPSLFRWANLVGSVLLTFVGIVFPPILFLRLQVLVSRGSPGTVRGRLRLWGVWGAVPLCVASLIGIGLMGVGSVLSIKQLVA